MPDQRHDLDETLDERVRSARHRLHDRIEPAIPDVSYVRRRMRRRRGVAAAMTVLVIAVGAIAVLRLSNDESTSPVVADEPRTGEGPSVTQPGVDNESLLDPGEARPMAPSPLAGRSSMASVWTGDEMIIWGGAGANGSFFGDGAAYDPETDTWRMLAPSPLSPRNSPAAVWTGDHVLFWGGHGPEGQGDGAAYDPATDTWRTIANAPIISEGGPQAVWTGDEMLIIAGVNGYSAAAYDPDSDSWREMPTVPGQPLPHVSQAVWTGDVMVVRASYPTASPISMNGGLFAYDPVRDRWSELPRTRNDDARLTHVAFTGEFLVRVTQGPDETIARYTPDAATWIGIADWPDAQVAMRTAVWTGNYLLLWGGGDDAYLVDPETGQVSTTPAGGGPARIDSASVWADGILIIWGGFPDMNDGLVLRPIRPPASTTNTTITIPDDPAPPSQGEPIRVGSLDGKFVGILDPYPGPVEVNGRLLPIQRVLDDEGNVIGYFGCSFLPVDVVESPDFDPGDTCTPG